MMMMDLEIIKMLQERNTGSRFGAPPEYLTVHYVGQVSSARNNCLYFMHNDVPASAHFFCDKDIYQSVALSRAAWHCGKFSATA